MTGALIVILALLMVLDWLQTLTIARNPHLWWERNPFLGRHPSVHRVHTHFALTGAGLALLVWLLPEPFAVPLLACMLVAEAICVINNHRLGIRP